MGSVPRRARAVAVMVALVASLTFVASPAVAVKPDPFCPTAFTAGPDEAPADVLVGYATWRTFRRST